MSASIYRLLRMAGYELLAADPVTELFTGRIYFNTVLVSLRVYDGAVWLNAVSGVGATLNEFHVEVGDNTNTPIEVDTSTLGDISADIVNGFKIKPTSDLLTPVGSIIAYNPGYYTNTANGGFTLTGPATNDAAGVNAFLPSNWRVCDGSALNDPDSPIWVGAGRNLPNLSDQRFIRGNTSCGTTGGAAQATLITANLPIHNHSMSHDHASSSTQGVSANHTHPMDHDHAASTTGSNSVSHQHNYSRVVGTASGGNVQFSGSGVIDNASNLGLSSSQNANHTHTFDVPAYSGNTNTISVDHSHTFDMPFYSSNTGDTGSGTAFDIIPKYLSTLFIVRVK